MQVHRANTDRVTELTLPYADVIALIQSLEQEKKALSKANADLKIRIKELELELQYKEQHQDDRPSQFGGFTSKVLEHPELLQPLIATFAGLLGGVAERFFNHSKPPSSPSLAVENSASPTLTTEEAAQLAQSLAQSNPPNNSNEKQ